jgi:hypothetical protein
MASTVTKINLIAYSQRDRLFAALDRYKALGKNPRWCAIGNTYFITTTPILEAEKKKRGIQNLS